MERVEAMLFALLPTLKQHQVGHWKPAEVDQLCAMLKEYGKQERQEKCGSCCSNGTATATAFSPSSSGALSSSPREDGDNISENDTNEEAFTSAVGEVDRCLDRVRHFLRRRVTFGSVVEPTVPAGNVQPQVPQSCTVKSGSKKRTRSPSEEVTSSAPTRNGLHSDAAAVATPVYAVDAFLYLEEDIERLVEEKKLAREYCRRCGGTDIGLAEFITHSFSQDQLVYLSCFLFPHLLDGVVTSQEAPQQLSIADVGSRTGIVLWACASALQWGLLAPQRLVATVADASDAAPHVQLVGIELDATFVKISRDVLRRFFAPRRRLAPKLSSALQPPAAESVEPKLADVSSNIQLLESDCFEGTAAAALSDSTLVVLHNVFEYFCPSVVEHARCWLKLRRLVHRPGHLLVTSPPLEETLSAFDDEVWRQACRLEYGDSARETTASSLAWLASYVEPVDTSEVASDFLTRRTLSSGDGGSDQGEHESDGHHHHHGCGCGPSHGCDEEEGDEERVSEVAEGIEQIRVYRVK
ncbi:hypothetical protein JKF63_05793 [Porcisia hertigi]|uniref:Uncharacterized protein n=1 Tax=Porcisia hertigi TaxID=2761500 RepID=A0A836IJQ3_9TRYP|nr:hypothetical protein JKF63_05793 [Porcisia hertigi]